MEKQRKPWWLYVNLLGLDAPLIALIWLSIFANTWRINYLPWEAYISLTLIVWAVRISLKLIYGSISKDHTSWIMYHERNLWIGVGISVVLALCVTLVLFPLSIYAYLLCAAVWIVGYLAAHFFSPRVEGQISYFHHFFGAMAFAYGVTSFSHVYLPNIGFLQLLLTREFLSFFILCLLCSISVELAISPIYTDLEDSDVVLAEEVTLSLPLTLLGAAALVFAVQNETISARPFYYAILTGAALLQILYRMKSKFDSQTVKILATLCLSVPGIVYLTFYAVS